MKTYTFTSDYHHRDECEWPSYKIAVDHALWLKFYWAVPRVWLKPADQPCKIMIF